MTASERIRAAREKHNSLVSALDQNPVETRKSYRVGEISEFAASEPGALDGFAATCSCGLRLSSSLRVMLVSDIAAHVAWHVKAS